MSRSGGPEEEEEEWEGYETKEEEEEEAEEEAARDADDGSDDEEEPTTTKVDASPPAAGFSAGAVTAGPVDPVCFTGVGPGSTPSTPEPGVGGVFEGVGGGTACFSEETFASPDALASSDDDAPAPPLSALLGASLGGAGSLPPREAGAEGFLDDLSR